MVFLRKMATSIQIAALVSTPSIVVARHAYSVYFRFQHLSGRIVGSGFEVRRLGINYRLGQPGFDNKCTEVNNRPTLGQPARPKIGGGDCLRHEIRRQSFGQREAGTRYICYGEPLTDMHIEAQGRHRCCDECCRPIDCCPAYSFNFRGGLFGEITQARRESADSSTPS